ncbi:glycosyltransferase family 9 protein [Saccharopolyspora rosea]|uniref:glycosyltransferase family 9 protein n=1 Tax=Saccharopolyspora rosea TaxID=524884 RepID=UPI0021D90630|nr:glycosyltransferase family 9 protein [Saccharopolyspora rosea]
MAVTVLVLRALGLGDLLTAVPALRALRRAHPGHRLVLAAPSASAELAPLTGAVDEVWPTEDLPSFHWPRAAPDVAVNLHGRGPQSIDAVLRSAAVRIITHAHPARSVFGPVWTSQLHEVRRWCDLLEFHDIAADPRDLLLPRPDESVPGGVVVVHPGAAHRARCWPELRYAAVARALTTRGERVVVTGGPAELPLARRVAGEAGLPPEAVLAGRTGLRRLAALVAEARLVVCGDTGVAHLATAYRTPSVVLFGPVSPALWGPPDDPRHTALWAGRVGDTFADRPDPGLLRIDVEQVVEACEAHLDALAGRRR